MCWLIFVKHRCSFTRLSQFHFYNFFIWIITHGEQMLFSMNCLALMLQLNLFASESSLSFSSIPPSLLDLWKFSFIIFGQNLLIIQISNFTNTIIRQRPVFPVSVITFLFLLLREHFFVFFFDKFHEFIKILNRIIISFFILFATRTIHMLMLLTTKILHNPLKLRRKISLTSIPFKGFHMFTKFF